MLVNIRRFIRKTVAVTYNKDDQYCNFDVSQKAVLKAKLKDCTSPKKNSIKKCRKLSGIQLK